MKPKTLKMTILIFLALNLSLVHAFADAPPSILVKNEIPRAITIAITPKGQKYFNLHLSQILGNLGLNLSEGYFNETTSVSDTPVKLSEIEQKYPEAGKLIKDVRTLLTQWLVGFSLNDHRPAFKMGMSEYVAEISRMGLLTDQNLMKQLNREDGAVLVFEMEIKKFASQFDYMKVWDVDNLHLGELGLKNVNLNIGGQKAPLFIRIPFYVVLNNQGEIRFEVLSFSSNLDTIPIELKYQHLIVPQLMVELNGKKYPLNNNQLEKTISDQMPQLLSKVREYVSNFAKNDLPQQLNVMADQNLKKQIEEVQHLPPPGRAEEDGRGDFLWGLRMTKLHLAPDQHLYVNFNAYVEDVTSKTKTVPDPKNTSKGAPQLVGEKIPHDLVMSLNRGVINRVLQLSFKRGYFEKIPQTDGTVLALRDVPSMDYFPTPAGEKVSATETFMKIHIKAELDPDSMFLENRIVLDFDLITKLTPAAIGDGMEIVQHSIDLNSVRMDKKYLAGIGNLIPGVVMDGIKKKLTKIMTSWKTTRSTLPGRLDLPPPVLGQKLSLQKVIFDPKGDLLMYLNFQEPSATNRLATEPRIEGR